MFEQHLEHMESVKIEGAPGWYYQQTSGHICNSAFALGGYESVNQAKNNARKEMETRINSSIRSFIYSEYRNYTSPEESLLIKEFSVDNNLPTFVESSVIYENIKYDQAINTAFVRVCITKPRLSSYQQERAQKIATSITRHRHNNAQDELKRQIQNRK